ncbi:MAG: MFS transporter [Anaerolineae bacterium]|jgi:MFS family permease
MKQEMRWHDYITINIFWLGIGVASGTITPILLPYLVALFAPMELKNTYLGALRVIGLAVAMLVQPMAGLLSDRNTSRWGRRRPYIFGGTLFNLLFLSVIGASPLFIGSALDDVTKPLLGVGAAYVVLVIGSALQQAAANVGHGALQGLIPDLVPEQQRGRASGVKGVMELMPIFFAVLIGPLVDAGKIWLTVGIIGASFLLTMLITVLTVHEEPLREKPTENIRGRILRLIALTVIFVVVTQTAVWIVRTSGTQLAQRGVTAEVQVAVVGLAGLIGMAGSIFVGVYFGAWVGIGEEARQQTPFIWWVINRLLFLAALNSIQGFAQFFLADVLHIPNAATVTTQLLAVVGVFLMITVVSGGYLADRLGRRRLVAVSGLIAAGGTILLLFSANIPLVLVSASIIGIGAGIFWASSWALGTDLAPKAQAGRYLGISNLAGAGAGIVGAGIGGPMADFFNAIQPGLGYLVIFALYAALFLLSVAALTRVKVQP